MNGSQCNFSNYLEPLSSKLLQLLGEELLQLLGANKDVCFSLIASPYCSARRNLVIDGVVFARHAH